jgi:DNA-directed RNA polymerase specialized sigma24 family protein
MGKDATVKEMHEIQELFRQHLKEQHNIDTDEPFDIESVKEHLETKQTLIPITIFSHRLSALESIVKYLRENEQLRNSQIAQMLGKSPASTWITYRNAKQKLAKSLTAEKTDLFIPTGALATGLSVLESIAYYLKQRHGFSYSKMGRLLNRNERTIWTVCNRARKKLGK